MSETKVLNKIKTLLGLEVKLEQQKLDNGTVVEAEVFEAGQDIFIITEDENVALPVGEYTLEDGRMLIISEEGVIDEIKDAESEDESAAEEAPAQEEEMKADEKVEFDAQAEIEALKSQLAELQEKFANLSKVEEVEELSSQVELSEEKKLTHSPEKEANKVESFKFSQNKIESTLDRVLNKLNK